MFEFRGEQLGLFEPVEAQTGFQRGPALPDLDVLYWPRFLSSAESELLFAELRRSTDWEGGTYRFKDKVQVMPRLIRSYKSREAFPVSLARICERLEAACDLPFDSVLLSLYRDERDSVTWHRDHEIAQLRPAIAALSLGETRRFRLRHAFQRDLPLVTFQLAPGSLLLMRGPTNDSWEHHVPKERSRRGERISLTFRRYGLP